MKKIISELNMIRIGDNKIYVGELKDNKCHGKCVLVFKNGHLYEG